MTYTAFCDLSGGGGDDATLAIAHEHNGVAVLDCLIDQGARINGTFSPEEAVKKFADTLNAYGCASVTGDRYAAQWPVQAFQKVNIHYRPADLNRSQLYAAFEPLLNSGRVELLDHPKLLQQFIGLVRKGEKIDHASGEHDDHCNAVAGVCVRAASSVYERAYMFNFLTGKEILSEDELLLRKEARLRNVSVESLRQRFDPVL